MSIPVLHPRFVLGLRTDVKGNARFINDEEIIYPVGGVLAVHNYAQKRQRFIKLPESGRLITSINVSPNWKIISIAEKSDADKPPSITLYDASTLKKRRQLLLPPDREDQGEELAITQFSFDSRYIIGITGEPDWMFYMFRTDKTKLESFCRANNPNGTGTVADLACNPNDVNLCAIVGKTVFRIMACQEGVWRQFGFSKADTLNVTAATWITQDRLMAGTADGKLMFIENSELKAIFWAGNLPIINLRMKDKEDLQPQGSETAISEPSAGSFHIGEDYDIRNIVFFPKGCMFCYLNGTVHLYEKETNHKYKKRNVYKVPNHVVVRQEGDEQNIMNTINWLDINPSYDRLIVTCLETQIYQVNLWGADMTLAPEMPFVELGSPLHHGQINGLGVCMWKPILLTSGEHDRTLRVWNYATEQLELVKQFQEDIWCLSLHPYGHYCLVGFSDKLRFMSITIDDFECIKEFNMRNCKECAFSSSGHMFAATNASVIQIYKTTTLEMLYTMKGHNGKIKSFSWSASDHKLTTSGTDGAVYEWDMISTRRIGEFIVKDVSFRGAVVSPDEKTNYAVSTDGYLRLMKDNYNVHMEVNLTGGTLENVVLSRSGQMLFASGNDGIVYSIKMPLTESADKLEFISHNTKVTKMMISVDDRYLFTVSYSCICIWKLLYTEGKAIKIDKDYVPSTDILISRERLEEKITQIKELSQRMHELITEHAYQIRQDEATHGTKVREIHEEYCAAIEELRDKNEQLEAEHAQEISHLNVQISEVKSSHEDFVNKLELNYNDKLIYEYDKYLQLEDKLTLVRKSYDKQLEDLGNDKWQSEEKITNEFLSKLQEKEVQVEELIEENRQKTKEHETIKQQIEDDADREIYEMKTAHYKEIRCEQDINIKLKGETGIIKKKLAASLKDTDELKHTIHVLENEHVKFKASIIGLEKDIADFKKEITERDVAIQDKERRIYELKHKNQELEKFKFILDFKIKELKSQIEPRDETIREQTTQINDMVNELENLQKIILNLDLQLVELREKLKAADNELRREVAKNRVAKTTLKTIRSDLHQASNYIQDAPKLKRSLKEMYHKYNADKDFELAQAEDTEAKNEFLRQRDFLERTIKILQKQASDKAKISKKKELKVAKGAGSTEQHYEENSEGEDEIAEQIHLATKAFKPQKSSEYD